MAGVKSSGIFIVGLRSADGMITPLAWTTGRLSKKQLRRVQKRFKPIDGKLEPACCMHWTRLYRSPREAQQELPRY